MSSAMSVDRTLFFGSRMPEEVSKSLALLRKADKARLRKALEISVETLKSEGEWSSESGKDTEAFTRLKALSGLTLGADGGSAPAESAELALLSGGIVSLLRAAIRLPSLKPAILKDDLLSLNLTQEFVADFVKVVEARSVWPNF